MRSCSYLSNPQSRSKSSFRHGAQEQLGIADQECFTLHNYSMHIAVTAEELERDIIVTMETIRSYHGVGISIADSAVEPQGPNTRLTRPKQGFVTSLISSSSSDLPAAE
jgi:hypothetical protein